MQKQPKVKRTAELVNEMKQKEKLLIFTGTTGLSNRRRCTRARQVKVNAATLLAIERDTRRQRDGGVYVPV